MQKRNTNSKKFQVQKAGSKEDSTTSEFPMRLNKYLAKSGVASRREADQIILDGKVSINGTVIKEMGSKVSRGDVVKHNGKQLRFESFVYLLLNKPKDFITTMDDPQNRRTVMELVGKACKERIYPVGRLDRNTTGLLLFTNDGNLSKKLMHPSHKVKKIYQVDLNKALTKVDLATIIEGFDLEDGPISVDDIAVLGSDRKSIGIEVHAGRNRIVRRIFEHFGYEILRLDRTMYGTLTKKELPRGKWRFLTDKELVGVKGL